MEHLHLLLTTLSQSLRHIQQAASDGILSTTSVFVPVGQTSANALSITTRALLADPVLYFWRTSNLFDAGEAFFKITAVARFFRIMLRRVAHDFLSRSDHLVNTPARSPKRSKRGLCALLILMR
ncbi:hypothetical protein BV22DRAFT_252296 [Leucogyrophana mollusca]|uniref:Uncharacterized protein n=1 Tax=Leucogyrophana mollusca TaxID=85980 RepID=A0ACB8BRC5_9AGAM|nr:hypothetical protein BV22DRAFT_252296 [Leucogyrophana mollusca]